MAAVVERAVSIAVRGRVQCDGHDITCCSASVSYCTLAAGQIPNDHF